MSMPLVSVHLVTWESESVLPKLLQSLHEQSFHDFSLIVVDNASKDKSVSLVRASFPKATIVANRTNLGFCAAQNQAIRLSESPCILFLNPDIILQRETLRRLFEQLEARSDVASIGTKLLKSEKEPAMIDCAGLSVDRQRRFTNRGEGEYDTGQYDRAEEVFGLSGALVLHRRAALEAVRFESEYLDEDFFAYKDDSDLAWRLQLAGWKSWYDPTAPAFHHRAIREERSLNVVTRRRKKPQRINLLSYRNHLLTLIKNDSFADWLFFLPSPLLYEAGKITYLLLYERSTLKGLVEAIRLYPRMRAKRAHGMSQRRIAPRELRKWFH